MSLGPDLAVAVGPDVVVVGFQTGVGSESLEGLYEKERIIV